MGRYTTAGSCIQFMHPTTAILKLRLVLRRKHLSLATERSYVHWLSRYINALNSLPAALPSEQKLERFLSALAARRDIAASTQHQAFNAVLFFYKHVLEQPLQNIDALRIHRPAHARQAPTLAETQALLETIPNVAGYPTRLLARLLYGCGLRVSEPLNLRIKDVRLEQLRLCVRGAKGGKDRFVALPRSLVPEVRRQILAAHTIWRHDCDHKIPVMLPQQLARKYPEYQFAWPWAWLFPAQRPCRHPLTGALVRYRMHEANLQRAVKIARRQLGLAVLPHELRHGYATHALERGTNPRAIQQAMGHRSLETTMGYLHAEALSVVSPLEFMPKLRAAFGPVTSHPRKHTLPCDLVW